MKRTMTEEKEQSTDLIPIEMALVAPVALEKVVATFRAFERMKKELLTDADWQRIGSKAYITKSGWLKIALACNISLEKREELREKDDDVIVYHYTYRAIAPSGRFADADGSASSDEKHFAHMPHDCRTLAQTRACNRAISNLAGGGEVSFEELSNTPQEKKTKKKAQPSTSKDKKAFSKIELKKGQTWEKIFAEFKDEIQLRQEQLGELWTFESAAVVFAREKGFVKK
ncbi:unnamed protein product [marine sediment metagenome]|uniref:Uncharacterized protein n=1 Tax=marine sediment metagenome TaxID=412755 RepID=X1U051_9ZZZZ